ncbi:MAG TPA: choice-of-anchor Q domain-containing protein [Patescibacteria group bacterium]|nr:choice-of-anchor Q domain-containing protein [Patescibacteria group bacterium]
MGDLCFNESLGCNSVDDALGLVNSANGDFRLAATSPAIGKADGTVGINRDYAGTTRPQGSSYDIGAYEYVSGQVLGVKIQKVDELTKKPVGTLFLALILALSALALTWLWGLKFLLGDKK